MATQWRLKIPHDEPLRVRVSLESMNRKTGPIPVTTSSSSTCPHSCTWFANGCYAETGWLGGRWRKVPEEGLPWVEFCTWVSRLPEGQLWRHNEAGDLPGFNEDVDKVLLRLLVSANRGRRGFTYTHKQWNPIFAWANRNGFTINISCDSEEQVDGLRREGAAAPLTMVVPTDSPNRFVTRGGNHVIVCPAQLREEVTCKSCGICAVAQRKAVVGFKAHGTGKGMVSRASVQRRLPLVV